MTASRVAIMNNGVTRNDGNSGTTRYVVASVTPSFVALFPAKS